MFFAPVWLLNAASILTTALSLFLIPVSGWQLVLLSYPVAGACYFIMGTILDIATGFKNGPSRLRDTLPAYLLGCLLVALIWPIAIIDPLSTAYKYSQK